MENVLKCLETVIVMLDGNEDFLKYVHADAEVSEEDAEYDRF